MLIQKHTPKDSNSHLADLESAVLPIKLGVHNRRVVNTRHINYRTTSVSPSNFVFKPLSSASFLPISS